MPRGVLFNAYQPKEPYLTLSYDSLEAAFESAIIVDKGRKIKIGSVAEIHLDRAANEWVEVRRWRGVLNLSSGSIQIDWQEVGGNVA